MTRRTATALVALLALPGPFGASGGAAQAPGAGAAASAAARSDRGPGSAPATYRLLPESRFEVRTETAGVLSRLVHVHVVTAGAFSGTLRWDADRVDRSSVAVTVPVDSLVVDTRADPDDRASIRATMSTRVLGASEHPRIAFRSTAVERAPGDSLRIAGELTLAGATRPVTVTLAHRAGVGRLWVWGSFTVRQTDFGIEPYSAGLGTLKVADEVTFYVDAVAGR